MKEIRLLLPDNAELGSITVFTQPDPDDGEWISVQTFNPDEDETLQMDKKGDWKVIKRENNEKA